MMVFIDHCHPYMCYYFGLFDAMGMDDKQHNEDDVKWIKIN